MIDIKALRAKTDEAIAKGKEQLKREAEAAKAAEIEKDCQEALKAENILFDLPSRCEAVAAKGENKLCVAKEYRYSYHKSTFMNRKWHSIITDGYCLILIEKLKKMGFTIEIRDAHDGVGIDSWAEVWISW